MAEGDEESCSEAEPTAQLASGRYRGQLVCLQLFNGDTTCAPEAAGVAAAVSAAARWASLAGHPQVAALRQLVAGRGDVAQELVGLRGRQAQYLRSQLELACQPE